MLEKMKLMEGNVLYITQSPYLSKHSRRLYYSHHYQNKTQQLSFLSFQEFLDSIEVPNREAMNFQHFKKWHSYRLKSTPIQNTHALFEEFRGVITGTSSHSAYLSKEAYFSLGVKQSIFLPADREDVYELFKKYLHYLKEKRFYDINLVSHDYLNKLTPQFDYIVIDEIQDMTNIQIMLILHGLHQPDNFLVCGDSNQLVHPNFFSWAKIKSLFLQRRSGPTSQLITRIITSNYRNSPQITALANLVLKLKNDRFGSIDHESHYLMTSNQSTSGEILLLQNNHETIKELNEKTGASKDFAVIVLHQNQKAAAKAHFKTPLIFSIQESKGLEYKNIILYNFISHDTVSFDSICEGINRDQHDDPFTYARNKNKKDKSLEIYKFYINALYVAITRAETSLYWIEEEKTHALLTLLGLQNSDDNNSLSSIQYHNSSDSEWQEEVSRLEAQGNTTQAQQIRDKVLKQEQPNWKVFAGLAINELFTAALEENDKKSKLSLFEYSLVYGDHHARNSLINIGFSPALKPYDGMQRLLKKHFMMYQQNQLTAIKRIINKYGVDYRNIFNQTPLMIAAWLGKPDIIYLVNHLGANSFLANNKGLNAFQSALEQACLHHYYAQNQFTTIYDQLKPEALSIRINNQLIKLSNEQPEFFFLNLMIALFYRILPENMVFDNGAFNGKNISASIAHFPEQLLPKEYHSPDYIDDILVRNQPFNRDKNSYPLFYSISEDQYIINPEIMLQVEGAWLSVYEILWIDDLALGYQENIVDISTNELYQNILNEKKQVYKELVINVLKI